ncbi:MAG: 2-hydroxyhepta-2,4-diene-1,7-dioate isomerase, partial [Alphaproteobacteria bacterium]|nr:2-hydroxyhepta-2,4-diene-1,7-dioate isomerase [Alphaproteobacteria bacterium]
MKLASYMHRGRESYGVVADEAVVDLRSRLPRHHTLLDVLRAHALDEVKAAAEGVRPDLPLGEVELLPPVVLPEKILCVGVNYANRNAEYKDGSELPKHPSLFFRTPGSFVGHGQPIVRPSVSAQLDYEGEIVLVIGREGRHIPAGRALEHVVGYTLCNEGSVRDWLRHGKFNVTQGKNFDRSGSLGPWIVTADEIDLATPLHLTTKVNGEVRQDDTTANLIFSFADLIAYITTFTTLKPGDLIVTGTPTGAGARFDPPRWLAPGDVVEVAVPQIGVL